MNKNVEMGTRWKQTYKETVKSNLIKAIKEKKTNQEHQIKYTKTQKQNFKSDRAQH